MPKITANNVVLNYHQQGSGEPLILIPYLAADHACYAFQLADYSKHFTCIALDLRGTGESQELDAAYSMQDLALDLSSFMQVLGIERAHIFGLSLGAAAGMCFAAQYPEKVKSLSLHSAWPRSDAYLKAVVQTWQSGAKSLPSVADMVVENIFPWSFTPELYAQKPDYIQSLAEFVRARPRQALEAFLHQSEAVKAHDALYQLGAITAPTQITFGRYDMVTSTRFAAPLTQAIASSQLTVFDRCAHAPIYEDVETFNAATLFFLKSNCG